MKDKKTKSERYSGSMFPPPQSASRALDEMVAAQEAPYGYTNAPPPYGHQNAEALENQRMQHFKKGR